MEVVAFMAEGNLHNGIMRRVAGGMRVFLSKIGFLKSDVTDVRLCTLLRDTERYLARKHEAARHAAEKTFYGTIQADRSEQAFLASHGVDLGRYDDRQGVFHARFGTEANGMLQAFPKDFEVDAVAVRAEARRGANPLPQDQQWLAERLAYLNWTINGDTSSSRAHAVARDEMRVVEQALRDFRQPASRSSAVPSNDRVQPGHEVDMHGIAQCSGLG